MLTQTLDIALTRFGFLRSKIDEVVAIDTLKLLRSLWVIYKGMRNPYIKRINVAGIDSGYNYIEYRGYALYAVNTVTVILNTDGEEDVDGWVDIDIVSTPNIEYELSLLSICMEVESMIKAMNRSELILIDGSLIALFSKLYKAAMDSGIEVLENRGIEIIDILKKLIYAVALNPRRFVFISKNSSAKDLLGLVKGDIYYLERYTDFEPGYTKPIDLAYSKHLGVATIAKLFKKYTKNLTGLDVSIGLTYIRFDSFTRVYRIEIVVDPNEDLNERIRYVINVLSDISISGYPYPLVRAHNLAKIGNRDIERISVLLGVAKDPKDREEYMM